MYDVRGLGVIGSFADQRVFISPISIYTENINWRPALVGHLIIMQLGAIVGFIRKCTHGLAVQVFSFWCTVDVAERGQGVFKNP